MKKFILGFIILSSFSAFGSTCPEVADKYLEAAKQVNDFRFKNHAELSQEQQANLRETASNLLILGEDSLVSCDCKFEMDIPLSILLKI